MKPVPIIAMLLALAMVTPTTLSGDEPGQAPLFHIERNKNANIIQYDARVGKGGLLDSKQPVVAYWVRLAEQGQVKKLTWAQKKFAFGFSAKLNKADNTAILDMKVNLGRTIMVKREEEDYRAITDINGVRCYVDRIFIQASGKGLFTRVEYIELYGIELYDHGVQYERFSP